MLLIFAYEVQLLPLWIYSLAGIAGVAFANRPEGVRKQRQIEDFKRLEEKKVCLANLGVV